MADGIDFILEADDTTLPTTGYILGADSKASARPSIYTAQGANTGLMNLGISVSGSGPLNEPFFGVGTTYMTNMWVSLRPTVSSETKPEVAQRIYVDSNAGGSDPGVAFKMGMYISVNGRAGTGDIFSLNTGTSLAASSGNVNATGYEIDCTNDNIDYGNSTAPRSFTFSPGPQFYGLQIVAGPSSKNMTAAIYLVDSNATQRWNRGFAVDNGVRLYSFEDGGNADTSYRDTGTHTTGIDLSGATYSGTSAIRLPNNKGLYGKDTGGTLQNLVTWTSADTMFLGAAGFATVVFGNNFLPATDNVTPLGSTTNRFKALHAVDVFGGNIGQMEARASVNFNAGNADTQIPITLPVGFTRYRMIACHISGASGTLTTATAGLFTAAGGGGVAIVTAASAITVATAAENTNNNMMIMTINNSQTQSYTATPLYFRVATPQGAAATGTVTITYIPVS